ncbi:alkaline phosphatase family protein [uncultured Friedmanniella sp.]|uniref:alkaline phosphatase family protein n=1 Tax=uncultured Friedmanniella sp. TaxID=335381 RepID=UPI0035CC5B7A
MTAAATTAPLPPLLLPAYSTSTLAELMPGIGHHLGVPGCDHDPLTLPPSSRYVVVLVDGLGWQLLRRASRDVPYLGGLLRQGQSITSGVPSTTVTSLTSLGTGLPPGQHGMVGYTARIPDTGEILNALTWESDLLGRAVQPRSTFFERAVAAGVAVSSVGLQRFAGSGLTEAALRGADFVPFEHERAEETRISLIQQAVARGDRSLVYAYERQLDHVGHSSGCDSEDWLRQLIRVDAMCDRIRDALPDDVVLVITGDHGMVDIPTSHQVLAEDEPDLMAGVDALAGEGRFRQLYVDHDNPEAVAARWRDLLGDRAWVRTREEAIDEGWFGPVAGNVRERYGHVLVAMRDTWAVMTRQYPRELSLVGMHGSLTPAEMLVPLLIA